MAVNSSSLGKSTRNPRHIQPSPLDHYTHFVSSLYIYDLNTTSKESVDRFHSQHIFFSLWTQSKLTTFLMTRSNHTRFALARRSGSWSDGPTTSSRLTIYPMLSFLSSIYTVLHLFAYRLGNGAGHLGVGAIWHFLGADGEQRGEFWFLVWLLWDGILFCLHLYFCFPHCNFVLLDSCITM